VAQNAGGRGRVQLLLRDRHDPDPGQPAGQRRAGCDPVSGAAAGQADSPESGAGGGAEEGQGRHGRGRAGTGRIKTGGRKAPGRREENS